MARKHSLQQMDERELLLELAKNQRRMRLDEYVSLALNVVLLLVLLGALYLVLPRVGDFLSAAESMEALTEQLKDTVADIDETMGKINEVITANEEGVTQVLENVNGIDYEKLNEAIGNLAGISTRIGGLLDVMGKRTPQEE